MQVLGREPEGVNTAGCYTGVQYAITLYVTEVMQ
jgi:hypothetical protein